MKLEKLKKELSEKFKNKKNSLSKKYKNLKNKEFNKEPKIIGITGSRGKSTTAYLVHNYLKKLGYKSILYSSIEIDSPVSVNLVNEPYEELINNEEKLHNLLVESTAYDADYIVLEIHEFVLDKEFIKNIPFDIRVLTNLNSKHNDELFTEEEYVNLKLSFFKDIDEENCECILGFQDYPKELLDKILSLNSLKKHIYSSGYVAETKGLDLKDLSVYLKELNTSLNGMDMTVNIEGTDESFKTNLIMSHNALNILGVITILNVLALFEINKFRHFIKDIKVPGRAYLIKVKNRNIIIDYFINPTLENLYQYKQRGMIKDIRIVTGAIGTGFITWNEKFSSDKFVNSRKTSRNFAMNMINQYADYVYLTENDNANELVTDICEELKSYLNEEKNVKIIVDRYEAIRAAIDESNENDVILITGRGERSMLCDTKDHIKYVRDRSVVEKILDKKEWYNHG